MRRDGEVMLCARRIDPVRTRLVQAAVLADCLDLLDALAQDGWIVTNPVDAVPPNDLGIRYGVGSADGTVMLRSSVATARIRPEVLGSGAVASLGSGLLAVDERAGWFREVATLVLAQSDADDALLQQLPSHLARAGFGVMADAESGGVRTVAAVHAEET